jgi:hypothetical protein
MRIVKSDHSKLARTDQQLRDLAASDADWFVRSVEDVNQLRETDDHPLAKLPAEDFRAFVDGLVFRKGGVAGGTYKPLMNTLNLPGIVEVFASLGMHMELFSDEANSSCQECACSPQGTCDFDFWSFCSSLCQPQVVVE